MLLLPTPPAEAKAVPLAARELAGARTPCIVRLRARVGGTSCLRAPLPALPALLQHSCTIWVLKVHKGSCVGWCCRWCSRGEYGVLATEAMKHEAKLHEASRYSKEINLYNTKKT